MKTQLDELLKIQKEFIVAQDKLTNVVKDTAKTFIKLYEKEFEGKFPTLEVYYGYMNDFHFTSNSHSHSYVPDVMFGVFCVKGDKKYNECGLLKMYNMSKENEGKFYCVDNPAFAKKSRRMSAKAMQAHLTALETAYVDNIGGVTTKELLDFAKDFNDRHFDGLQVLKYYPDDPDYDLDEDEE